MARTNNKVAPRLYVTAAMLKRRGACSMAQNELCAIFKVGRTGKVFFTKANAEKIRDATWLNINWLADRVLSRADYDKAWGAWLDSDVGDSHDFFFAALEAHRKSLAVSR